jgi:putative ABC transport system permease protein
LSAAGGLLGVAIAIPLITMLTHRFIGLGIPLDMKVKAPTAALALLVSVTLGIVSGYLPARRASRMNIVEGLRHIG